MMSEAFCKRNFFEGRQRNKNTGLNFFLRKAQARKPGIKMRIIPSASGPRISFKRFFLQSIDQSISIYTSNKEHGPIKNSRKIFIEQRNNAFKIAPDFL